MEYVSIIAIFIISILISLLTYYLLKNKGFKWALIIKIIIQFIIILIENEIPNIIKNNFILFIAVIISVIIIQAIQTGIQFFAYKKTNSFIFYLIVSSLLWKVVSFILSKIVNNLFYMLI